MNSGRGSADGLPADDHMLSVRAEHCAEHVRVCCPEAGGLRDVSLNACTLFSQILTRYAIGIISSVFPQTDSRLRSAQV